MHIVQFENGKYAVRRFCIVIFQYMGNDGFWWTGSEYISKYCLVDSAEEARQRARAFGLKVKWIGSYK